MTGKIITVPFRWNGEATLSSDTDALTPGAERKFATLPDATIIDENATIVAQIANPFFEVFKRIEANGTISFTANLSFSVECEISGGPNVASVNFNGVGGWFGEARFFRFNWQCICSGRQNVGLITEPYFNSDTGFDEALSAQVHFGIDGRYRSCI